MTKTKSRFARDVYLVDGLRTPFLKARAKTGPFSAADLGVAAGRSLLMRQPFAASAIDEVIMGCVMPNADEANIARIIALRSGCGKQVPAWTVQRNCASGLQSLDSAAQQISSGRADLVLAGGTEAMSHAPILYSQAMADWLGGWQVAKKPWQKLAHLAQLRPRHFAPIIGLLRGLTDPIVGLSMGQTAENLAYRFAISREEMDSFAARSHQRALQAQAAEYFSEIMPLYDTRGRVYKADDGVRSDSTNEKLAKLRPFFDRKFGKVTPGNSSQITDGAAMLVLASAKAVKQYKLPVVARIVDVQWASVGPEEMGLGPAHAIPPLLARQNMALADIDFWEINEAFAAQVLACLAAWDDEEYCKQELGLPDKLGKLDQSKLNIDGGATALGHPVGASGSRLVLHLAEILQRQDARFGIVSLCIGGGQGGAMLLERVTKVA